MSKKISVIIPTYNCKDYIDECVKSVQDQTYDNVEIIMVDDSSSDGTQSVLESIEKKYQNVQVIYKEKNTGVSDTRNIGVEKATGDWLTFLDADDWYEKDALKSVVDIIDNDPDVDVVQCNIIERCVDGSSKLYIPNENLLVEGQEKKRLIDTIIAVYYSQKKYNKYGNCRCAGAKFYRTSLIKDNGIVFPKSVKKFEDGIFNLYAYYLSKKIYLNSEAVYNYRRNNASVTKNINRDDLLTYKKVLQCINKFIKQYGIDTPVSYDYCVIELYFGLAISLLRYYKPFRDYKFMKRMLNNRQFRHALKSVDKNIYSSHERLYMKILSCGNTLFSCQLIHMLEIIRMVKKQISRQ